MYLHPAIFLWVQIRCTQKDVPMEHYNLKLREHQKGRDK